LSAARTDSPTHSSLVMPRIEASTCVESAHWR